jgi:hypothetical protein
MAIIADQACAVAQKVAETLNEGMFPRVEFLVVAFDPSETGAHAVTASMIDPAQLRRALHAATEQLNRFLAERARATGD